MKNRFSSATISLAVVCSLSVFASACSDARTEDGGWEWSGPVGSLGLSLELAPGVVLSTIEYEITGQGFTRTGSLPVSGNGTTFTATISEIPVGTGHTIRLRSVAAGDAGLACAGSATFSVLANTTTAVDIVLSCDGLDLGGSAAINGSFNICPSVTSTTLSPTVQVVGGTIAVALSARDVDMAPQPLTYAWTANTGTLSGATTTTPSLLCTQAGPVALTYTVRDGACVKTATLNASCGAGGLDGGSAPDAGSDAGSDAGVDAGSGNPANIVLNETESSAPNGGPDFAELFNKGAQAVNLSGWVIKDNDDTHVFTIPAGTVIQPGAYLVFEDGQFGFGLGSGDSVRVYLPGGSTLVDSYSWTSHAVDTYGRCPNGLGAFGQTPSSKGTANACGISADAGTPDASVDAGSDAGSVAVVAWPGSNTVADADAVGTWSSNLSGLTYQAGTPNILWAAQNGPSTIYRLEYDGTIWKSSSVNGWGAGKSITYPSGSGAPDSESITVGGGGLLYVSTERDNNASSVSKLSILQYDPNAPGTTLTALKEWNLTADLPVVGANLGLEAITFIADSELAEQSFKEQSGAVYNQARYAQNGGGVFVVGVEGTGAVHVYALDHGPAGGFTRLSSFASGLGGVMGIEYDPTTNYLWVYGDDTQNNRAVLFEIEQSMISPSYGRFVARKIVEKPSGLPATNNEGIAFVPDSQCVAGFRDFFWSDDNALMGHSLRRGSITCGKSY
jgi:Lamin Tail Domain/Esterase-like activity of phytase